MCLVGWCGFCILVLCGVFLYSWVLVVLCFVPWGGGVGFWYGDFFFVGVCCDRGCCVVVMFLVGCFWFGNLVC